MEQDIQEMKQDLKAMFPDLNVEKLQKVHTRKSVTYNQWLEKHCHQATYW